MLGRNEVVQLDNAAGSLTPITTYLRNISDNQSSEPGDATTMGSKSSGKLAGIDDYEASGDGLWVDAFDGILNAALGRTRSFERNQGGTGSGRVNYTGEVIVTSYEIEINFDSEVTVSFDLVATGGVSRGSN